MERIKLLQDWDYPVCQHPEEFLSNIRIICNWCIPSKYQFVGIGASGAMILGALSISITDHTEYRFTLLRKTSFVYQYTEIDNDLPIVVIDDDINSGRTMRLISDLLELNGKAKKVVGVVARSKGDESRFRLDLHAHIIRECFKNLEWWIY